MPCEVCFNEDESPLFKCQSCNLKVHTMCYGIDDSEQAPKTWKCSKCLAVGLENVKCELCVRTTGALKPTTDNRWVHVICSLFIDGCTFPNTDSMEPIDITEVKPNKNVFCYICSRNEKNTERRDGAFVQCSQKSCNKYIHVTCGQKDRLLRETVTKRDSIHYHAFCSRDHLPASSDLKKISGATAKKHRRSMFKSPTKGLVSKAQQENVKWVLGGTKVNTENNIEGHKKGGTGKDKGPGPVNSKPENAHIDSSQPAKDDVYTFNDVNLDEQTDSSGEKTDVNNMLYHLNVMKTTGVQGIEGCKKCVQYEIEIETLRLLNYRLQLKRKNVDTVETDRKKSKVRSLTDKPKTQPIAEVSSDLPQPLKIEVSIYNELISSQIT